MGGLAFLRHIRLSGFVQFGANYNGARDKYVYVVSQANNDAYEYSPDIVMARVPEKKIADRGAYDSSPGWTEKVNPTWARTWVHGSPSSRIHAGDACFDEL